MLDNKTIRRRLEADRARMRDWNARLQRLQGEMEKRGETPPGVYDDKLETLVRYAVEESYDELKRLTERLGERWP